ncbi:MAG: glycerol kinase GlpK, partial [Planctomycetota bacterium]
TSSRFVVFDGEGREIAAHQLPHAQSLPRAGWVEHDAVEIRDNVEACASAALRRAGLVPGDLACVGLTNQRETIVAWNPRTGEPWAPAIVWQDTRTADAVADLERQGLGPMLRERTGLPPATYFSATKIRWLLDHVGGLQDAVERGDVLCGTIDTWLVWNLTGGVEGGLHITDVTNASRTQLMGLEHLGWDDELLRVFGIPRRILPRIVFSSGDLGAIVAPGRALQGVPIRAVLGDQQAAMVGHGCLSPGLAKNTYGTGSFLLQNTGDSIVPSKHGLLTTVCYRFGEQPAAYALEGSIAVTGSAVQWLRDQLGILGSAAEIEPLARQVEDTGGVYFVPAFSGLFAPYWRPEARGLICGLSRFSNRAHLARATLESICFQTRDVVEAMNADAGIAMTRLDVDGGATANDLLMQMQADLSGIAVRRPRYLEVTALGAARAAAMASGRMEFGAGASRVDRIFEPQISADAREAAYAGWKRAVARAIDQA